MSAQFVYFITVAGNEDLLKEEINLYYPNLKFAYSRPGFCTFKNETSEKNYSKVVYALTFGTTLKKINLAAVEEYYKELSKEYDASFNFYQIEKVQNTEQWYPKLESKADNKIQIDFIRTNTDEVFVGIRELDIFNSPFKREYETETLNLVSRAYYKAHDAFKLFDVARGQKVLELGSVPGGISQFLLEDEHRVTAIDPGKMHESIMAHPKFKFLNLSVQDYKPYPSERFDIVVSDMNLNPKIVLAQISRIVKTIKGVKEVYITIKTSTPQMVKLFSEYEKLMRTMGCKKIHFLQLPKHRREFLAYGKL